MRFTEPCNGGINLVEKYLPKLRRPHCRLLGIQSRASRFGGLCQFAQPVADLAQQGHREGRRALHQRLHVATTNEVKERWLHSSGTGRTRFLINDRHLAKDVARGERALERSRVFTWRQVAEQTVEVYRRVNAD